MDRRYITVPSVIAWAVMAAMARPADAAPVELPVQVLRAGGGQVLARDAGGSVRAAVAQALRARADGAALAQTLVEVDGGGGVAGRRHVRLDQHVGGLKVHGASVKATFDADGNLVHLIEKLAALPATAPRAARIGERRALEQAMARVHPGVRTTFAPRARSGALLPFLGGAFFHEDPTVERVLVPQQDGSLAEAFLVQTWTVRDNLLDHTLVDGDGQVISVERRTANDSYNVFPVAPGRTPQAIVAGPGSAGNAQSPSGWLGTGSQTTIRINGNNVSAYLDVNANNAADTGGTSVAGGNFTTAANLAQAPSTTANRAVAVQNLFYLNNVIHDILYRHGFNEAAGNFQINNFGKGGRANDPVNAEAQDGADTNNANFATPADGSRPRMQMFLFSGAGPTHEVLISGGPTYAAKGANFGTQLTTTGLTGTIVAGNDGVAASGGGTATDGCEALPASVSGRIVLLDRGFCAFTTKVQNAANARASGVIIANNAPGEILEMQGTLSVSIPVVMIGQADGADLRARANPSGTMRRKAVQPLQVDASLDSDVVFHEYGHGLTWRMIGGMSGPLSGAIGEGASDTVAFLVNGDDVIGEYASSSPTGIRRYRYAGYPLTYANVTGTQVHGDGEIYAAAMWRLRELWLASGRSNDSLFGHFVDGMNYTPSSPAYENMRDGMLDAIAATAGADAGGRCALVWQAFAQFGIGDGARGTVLSTTSVSITPSNVARSDCTH